MTTQHPVVAPTDDDNLFVTLFFFSDPVVCQRPPGQFQRAGRGPATPIRYVLPLVRAAGNSGCSCGTGEEGSAILWATYL